MRRVAVSLATLLLLWPAAGQAQDRAAVERVAAALGAGSLKSLEVTASGMQLQVGQSAAPGLPWPRFVIQRMTRTVNYETATLRDELVRTQGENPPRGGGVQPVRGEQRQVFVVGGDHAWNVVGDAAVPAPIGLAERQFQLWATPHGIVKAALAGKATMQGRTISFTMPGRFTLRATVDGQGLIEKVEGVLPNPVVGDLPVEIVYADYRDFDGVKFPTRIRQKAAGFPSLDLTVSAVRPNPEADIPVPDAVRQAPSPYARVATQMVADGVWYLTGGSHHSVVIEMKDHLIVVEAPLNEERALAVLAEAKTLAPGKPVRYVVNSHHHFDHAGGLRAVAAEGITVITHAINRTFFERALAAPATVSPDRMAQAPRKPQIEGVRERRVLTDGTRTVEIHHLTGNTHDDGLLLVYLPKEKLLSQADAYTPLPANAPPPAPVSPFSVNLADTIARLKLTVDRLLPLHGRIVPLEELHRTIGRAN